MIPVSFECCARPPIICRRGRLWHRIRPLEPASSIVKTCTPLQDTLSSQSNAFVVSLRQSAGTARLDRRRLSRSLQSPRRLAPLQLTVPSRSAAASVATRSRGTARSGSTTVSTVSIRVILRGPAATTTAVFVGRSGDFADQPGPSRNVNHGPRFPLLAAVGVVVAAVTAAVPCQHAQFLTTLCQAETGRHFVGARSGTHGGVAAAGGRLGDGVGGDGSNPSVGLHRCPALGADER